MTTVILWMTAVQWTVACHQMMDGSDSSAFITILSTGAYRVKGKVNEQNRDSIVPGEAVIIRSRVDSSKTWKGTMGSIDMNNGTSDEQTAVI